MSKLKGSDRLSNMQVSTVSSQQTKGLSLSCTKVITYILSFPSINKTIFSFTNTPKLFHPF